MFVLVSEKYEWYILYIIWKNLQTEDHLENQRIDDKNILILFLKAWDWARTPKP
jgi:hypothetical protein